MAERLYLEDGKGGSIFGPFMLPQTVRVSVNPKTMRPYYLVYWASFRRQRNLPMVYMATVEDSSEKMIRQLVDSSGKLNPKGSIFRCRSTACSIRNSPAASTISPRRTPPTR